MSGDDHSVFTASRNTQMPEHDIIAKLTDGVLRPGGLPLTKRMVDCCAFLRGAKVVDIGCGTGVSVAYLREIYGFDAVGVDTSAPLLRQGKSRFPGLPLLLSRGKALPFARESVHGALAECSMSVMGDADIVLAEISRILVPGGKLAIADIYIRETENAKVLRGLPRTGCLAGALMQAELLQKLGEHGFSLIVWEDQSKCLKEFMARLIMECDTFDECWQNALFGKDGGQVCHSAIKKAAWGYFWLVAEKAGCGS